MAHRVTPTPPDADNLSGTHRAADPIDWRCGDADFHVGTGHQYEPTSDAGYTTAGSTRRAHHQAVSLWQSRGSPYM